MRTVTYSGAVSLDGFLTAADGSIDWIQYDQEIQQVLADLWKNIDTILMGRKTYDFAAGAQGGGTRRKQTAATTSGTTKADARPKSKPKPVRKPKVPAIRTYVFSRTLTSIDAPGVELVSGDAAAFVRDLKQRPGKDIFLMGGGELAQSLIAEGLVDEIGLSIHPILLGGGAPVFRDPGHRVKLTLAASRALTGGCILANYKVVPAR